MIRLRVRLCVIVGLAIGWPPAFSAQSDIRFEEITESAGIEFTHNSGATGKKYLPETMGPGAAFLDFNNDGWADIFLVNGTNWPGDRGPASTPDLYRNDRNGTFTNVTRAAGLDLEFYGLGVAVADYDNDGDEDLFVSALGQDRLFSNAGDGTFDEVTQGAGLEGPRDFSTSALWSDYDIDGDVDLFVASYVDWSIENDLFCEMAPPNKSYCTPEPYNGASMRLWRNDGAGGFEDYTEAAELLDRTSKGLGLAVFDANQNGLPDILLVNDTEPNRLYRNSGDGTFTENAFFSGIATSADGVARAGMGVDAADYDRSGYPSVIIGNFSNQMLGLYHNEAGGRLFIDDAVRSEVGQRSLRTLSFACLFMDYDLDGWLDIFVANGHIEPEIERIQETVKHAQPPHMFRNTGSGFTEVTASLGGDFATPRVGRAAAYGDIDNDGDLDLLITANGGPAALFRNDGTSNRSIRIKLIGTDSNRSGLGAKVTVTSGSDVQTQTLHSGAGYLSQSELVLTFGLGRVAGADTVEVLWPNGATDRLLDVPAGNLITIGESRGQIGLDPFALD